MNKTDTYVTPKVRSKTVDGWVKFEDETPRSKIPLYFEVGGMAYAGSYQDDPKVIGGDEPHFIRHINGLIPDQISFREVTFWRYDEIPIPPNREYHHELKTDPEVFDNVVAGLKKFEIRLNDRNYRVGDILTLKKTTHCKYDMVKGDIPLKFTGDVYQVKVVHILYGLETDCGLDNDLVIMSIEPAS